VYVSIGEVLSSSSSYPLVCLAATASVDAIPTLALPCRLWLLRIVSDVIGVSHVAAAVVDDGSDATA
jgi:hypothetical protein